MLLMVMMHQSSTLAQARTYMDLKLDHAIAVALENNRDIANA